MRLDLHVHSKYSSDGYHHPKDIVRAARLKGLDGIAITDHNTIKGAIVASKHTTPDFTVIVGAEIATERGEIMGLFLTEEISAH